jgi:hypothetical protein
VMPVARLRRRRFHMLADAANASPSPFASRGITSRLPAGQSVQKRGDAHTRPALGDETMRSGYTPRLTEQLANDAGTL